MTPARGRTRSRFWPNDEEMAKRDDDLRSTHPRISTAQWQASTRPPRRRALMRLVAYIVVLVLVVSALLRFLSSGSGAASGSPGRSPSSPATVKGSGSGSGGGVDRSYDGPVKFAEFARTLTAITETGGGSPKNRNVLFVAASLASASTLLPMACQMFERRHNYVHFVFLGRSEISLQGLLETNGIDESCKLFMHDARPVMASTSNDNRMVRASLRALFHIETYMHPQAIILDGSHAEEKYLLEGFRDQIRLTKSTLIELPDRPETRLAWIAELDAPALSAWNKVHFDILVQAPPIGSSNLGRLLNSLSRADLSAVSTPHLTIELPSIIDDHLERFLGAFQWPPGRNSRIGSPSSLSLRRRIPNQRLTEEESSVRFLESFWPSSPAESHVLILAPHTEVTPQFFHYVKFTLLQTMYSTRSVLQDWNAKMMGMSILSPDTLLDSKTPFEPPATRPQEGEAPRDGTPFLWQAPSSEATLIFGEKWVELHGYVTRLLEKHYQRDDMPAMLAKKEASKKHPAWLEYVLQLARLRGYVMYYPSRDTAKAVIGAHSDLDTTPEEYIGDEDADEGENGAADRSSSVFDPAGPVNMLATLPDKGRMMRMQDLPMASWDGKPLTVDEMEKLARKYAREFRREVGQCKDAEEREGSDEYVEPSRDRLAADLFCGPEDKAKQDKGPAEKGKSVV